MMNLRIFVAGSMLVIGQTVVAEIGNVSIDRTGNVHVKVYGTNVQLTKRTEASDAQLSSDKKMAAWLVLQSWATPDAPIRGSDTLAIYANGRIRYIRCAPFIRQYWFWRGSSRIEIDCGGLHFAGREILYDTATLAMVDSFDQAEVRFEDRPVWSEGSPNFQRE